MAPQVHAEEAPLRIGDVAKLAGLSIAALTEMRDALGRLVDQCRDTCAPGACAFLDELAQPFDG